MLKWSALLARWIVGLVFVLAGSGKFSVEGNLASQFTDWGYPLWLLFLVGTIECGGGLLFIAGRKMVLAGLALAAIMLGAIITHLRFPETMGLPALPLAMLIGIGYVLFVAQRSRETAREPIEE